MPNISNWDTKNVSDMGYIFYECSSLSELPDISKWNTKKVSNIYQSFNQCVSLLVIPHLYH